MRLGLSVWFGSGTFATAESSANADVTGLDSAVGSHVDLLPTIAHAAGCKPDVNGQYSTSERKLAGRSLLPLLSPKVASYNEGNANKTTPIVPRRYAFAERSDALPALVSANPRANDDIPTLKLCGANKTASLNLANTVYPCVRAVRRGFAQPTPTVPSPLPRYVRRTAISAFRTARLKPTVRPEAGVASGTNTGDAATRIAEVVRPAWLSPCLAKVIVPRPRGSCEEPRLQVR